MNKVYNIGVQLYLSNGSNVSYSQMVRDTLDISESKYIVKINPEAFSGGVFEIVYLKDTQNNDVLDLIPINTTAKKYRIHDSKHIFRRLNSIQALLGSSETIDPVLLREQFMKIRNINGIECSFLHPRGGEDRELYVKRPIKLSFENYANLKIDTIVTMIEPAENYGFNEKIYRVCKRVVINKNSESFANKYIEIELVNCFNASDIYTLNSSTNDNIDFYTLVTAPQGLTWGSQSARVQQNDENGNVISSDVNGEFD